MKPTKTWIVLADAHCVRIAVHDGPQKKIYGLSTLGLRARPVSDLSDAPGMTKAPVGPDRGNISDPDLKGLAAESFAHDIIDFLISGQDADAFQRLVIIAPPPMLGILRQKMTPNLTRVLRADIPKDLTHLPLGRLARHLKDVLPV